VRLFFAATYGPAIVWGKRFRSSENSVYHREQFLKEKSEGFVSC